MMKLWSLIRKNLWLWGPTRGANIYVLGFFLLFSCADAFFHFPNEPWFFICMLSVFVTQGAASSAVSVDAKDNNDLFLEYLPVRWSQLWFANWLDGLALSLLMVPCLCWCRVITWVPPGPIGFEDALFKTRWTLPCGLACIYFLLFSYAIMWRTFFKSEKAAVFLTLIGELFFVIIPLAMLAYMVLLPGIWDLWPLLLFQGAAFSLCSYIIFARVPRYWSAIYRFLVAGIPAIFATTVLFYGGLWLDCLRWQRLDWTETGLAASVDIASADHRALIATICSSRSFNHNFLCNTATGEVLPLGRNLELMPGQESFGGNEPLILQSSIRIPEWHISVPITEYFPNTRRSVVLLPKGTIDDQAGDPITIDSASACCGKILLSGYATKIPSERYICVTDQRGTIERQWTIPNVTVRPVHSDSGKVLMVASSGESVGSKTGIQYRVYDLNARSEATFTLPGRAVCFSKDFTLCACLEMVRKGDVNEQLVSLINTHTLNRQVILPVGILPSVDVPTDAPATKTGGAYNANLNEPIPIQSRFGFAGAYSDLAIAFDADFQRGVLLIDRIDGPVIRYSIVSMDMRALTHTVLIPESGFSAYRNSWQYYTPNNNPPSLIGLTSDSKGCIYQTANQILIKRIDSETIEVSSSVGTKVDVNGNGGYTLSPSGRSILLTRNVPDMQDGKRDQRSAVEVIGRPETHFTLPNNSTFEWLDDDRLVMTSGAEVSITDTRGRVQKRLFPIPSSLPH